MALVQDEHPDPLVHKGLAFAEQPSFFHLFDVAGHGGGRYAHQLGCLCDRHGGESFEHFHQSLMLPGDRVEQTHFRLLSGNQYRSILYTQICAVSIIFFRFAYIIYCENVL